MGSREKDQTTPHQLSSLVVRPTGSGGAGGGGGAGSDYEPGEVRLNDPPTHGYRIHAGSASPVRRRNEDHRYSPGFIHSGGPVRNHGFGGSRRGTDRYRDYSHPYGPGRDGIRFAGRGSDRPGLFRGGAAAPNNPNVKPRDGDWFCSDPSCGNLNFARRESCNNCKRPRHSPAGNPRRAYPGSPPPVPRRFPALSRDTVPGRSINGYRSPPRGWARDGPRDFRSGDPLYPRREGRFPDPPIRGERQNFPGDDFRARGRLERPISLDIGHRNRERDSFFRERNMYDRRPPSPLPPAALPPRGHWDRGIRERSRSPMRDAAPPKDHHRDMYMERGNDRRGISRGAY